MLYSSPLLTTVYSLHCDGIINALYNATVSFCGRSYFTPECFTDDYFCNTAADLQLQQACVSALYHIIPHMTQKITCAYTRPDAIVKRLKTGIVLSLEEIHIIRDYACMITDMRSYIAAIVITDEYASAQCEWYTQCKARLYETYEMLPDVRAIYSILAPYITDDGVFREADIAVLQQIKQARQIISSQLDQISVSCAREHISHLAQDIPCMRFGRIVLAVKAGQQYAIEGFHVDSSSSGATVFIEPFALHALNNALLHNQAEYRQAIQNIMRELSAQLIPYREDLLHAEVAVLQCDIWLSKAYVSRTYNGELCSIGTYIHLPAARNIMMPDVMIPIDIIYDEDTKIVVISGANAGGKTVALKTLGLCSFCFLLGMRVPCGVGGRLPFFRGIYASIGDAQSLTEGLSSFSGQLLGIGAIFNVAQSNSLLLFDEPYSGTNHNESAALAIATAKYMMDHNYYACLTTHNAELKQFAYLQPGMQNSAMLFDAEQHKPLYCLQNNSVDESHAFEIARFVGFPALIIEEALAYVADKAQGSTSILMDIIRLEKQLRDQAHMLAEKESALAEKEAILIARDEKAISDELEKLQHIRKSMRKQWRGLQKKWQHAEKTHTAESEEREVTHRRKEGEHFLHYVQQTHEDMVRMYTSVPTHEVEHHIGMPCVGDIIDYQGKRAHVLRIGKKEASIKVDLLRISVSLAQLAQCVVIDTISDEKMRIESMPINHHATISLERKTDAHMTIDIRGMHVLDGIALLAKQLDACMAWDRRFIAIIHGKGSGALQEAVHDYLKENSFIAHFEFAHPDDGGSGKTYAWFHQ